MCHFICTVDQGCVIIIGLCRSNYSLFPSVWLCLMVAWSDRWHFRVVVARRDRKTFFTVLQWRKGCWQHTSTSEDPASPGPAHQPQQWLTSGGAQPSHQWTLSDLMWWRFCFSAWAACEMLCIVPSVCCLPDFQFSIIKWNAGILLIRLLKWLLNGSWLLLVCRLHVVIVPP